MFESKKLIFEKCLQCPCHVNIKKRSLFLFRGAETCVLTPGLIGLSNQGMGGENTTKASHPHFLPKQTIYDHCQHEPIVTHPLPPRLSSPLPVNILSILLHLTHNKASYTAQGLHLTHLQFVLKKIVFVFSSFLSF